jgi:hypothetical protein
MPGIEPVIMAPATCRGSWFLDAGDSTWHRAYPHQRDKQPPARRQNRHFVAAS